MSNVSVNEVPDWYPVCIKSDCPLASHCLRQIAMRLLTEQHTYVRMVNPLIATCSEQCRFYLSDEKQRYGRGFKKMQNEMLPRQYQEFMCRLIGQFGRTGYFERRRGERLCSPPEVQKVKNVLKGMGLDNLEFDKYEMRYFWDE
jgi:hypothetical protein